MKRALVIEGGGMRSSYVSGALLALYDLGPREFDLVIGTSAGACCAANFIVGRPQYNQFVLEERLSSSEFINFKRIFSKKNIMDIDFLLDQSFETLPTLRNVLKVGKTKFLIATTDCNNGETLYFDAAKEDPRELIRTSCAIPYLYRRKIYREGRRFMDGAITSSIPIKKAMEEGCNKIYVICSRPLGYRKKPSSLSWINHLAFPTYPRLVKALRNRHVHYNQALDLMENPPEQIQLIAIRPQHGLPVSRVTRDRIKIRQAIQQGFYDAYHILTEEKPPKRQPNLDVESA